MTKKDIKRIIYGWNELHPKATGLNISAYETQTGGSRADASGKGGRGVELNKPRLIQAVIEQLNKKEKVLTSEEIAQLDKVLQEGIEKIKAKTI